MKHGCALLCVGTIVLLIAMTLTCPKKMDHQAALRNTLREIVNTKIDEVAENEQMDASASTFTKMVGQMAITQFGDVAIDQLLSVDDYVLFSVGHLKYGQADRIVSLGLLNHVFTPSTEDISEELQRHGL